MRFLAISGSTRKSSTNTTMLRAFADVAPHHIEIAVFHRLQELPIFSPDLESRNTPQAIDAFCEQIRNSDGLIISSPEYVRAIPGGLKNAIDWLVSRDEIVNKPTVIVHASHRGEDLLQSLRAVLRTVTTQFDEEHFLRFSLMSRSPDDVKHILLEPENVQRMRAFLAEFSGFVNASRPNSEIG